MTERLSLAFLRAEPMSRPIVICGMELLALVCACSAEHPKHRDSSVVASRSARTKSTSSGEVAGAPKPATPAELDDLRAELMIPLPGVRPTDLHDTYKELRGARIHEALD